MTELHVKGLVSAAEEKAELVYEKINKLPFITKNNHYSLTN